MTIDNRPVHLCSSTVPLKDLMAYVPHVCRSEWVIWTHVTSPFLDSRMILDAVRLLETSLIDGYDSLMGVTRIQKYLWDKENGCALNYDHMKTPWPSTQTLPELYEVNSSLFIARRDHYIQMIDRIGKRPVFWETPYPGAIDIDWEEDFSLAEMIYTKRYANPSK